MTNKYPIGSQWKTRAGHRAVVVDNGGGVYSLQVWNSSTGKTIYMDGEQGRVRIEKESPCDLLTPWTEPRKGTFWVNVYENENRLAYSSRKSADIYNEERIACIQVSWQEGDGL